MSVGGRARQLALASAALALALLASAVLAPEESVPPAPAAPGMTAGAPRRGAALPPRPRGLAPAAASAGGAAPEAAARARLRGRVRDAADGSPLAGAWVAVRLAGSEAPQPLLRAVTDAEGAFAFEPAPAAALELVAVAEGWLVSPPRRVPPGAGEVELALERGLRVAGRVIGADPDLDPAEVWVALEGAGPAFLHDDAPVQARADGRFELLGVPPGSGYVLTARAASGARGVLPLPEVAPPGLEGLLLELRTLELRGRVEGAGALDRAALAVELRPAGSPPGAPATARAPLAPGDRFALAVPEPGEWEARAVGPAGVRSPWTRAAVDEGAPAAELVLTLGAPFTLRGRVLRARGAPLAGASVTLRGEPAWACDPASVRTGEDGAFALELRGVPPSLVLAASHPDCFPARHVLRATPGGEVASFDLVLEPIARPIPVEAGPFLGPDGRPLSGVTLALDPDDPDAASAEAVLDAEGRPELTTLGPGRWTVSFLEPAADELRAWTLQLELEPGDRVTLAHREEQPRGRVEGAVRGPLARLLQLDLRPHEPAPGAFTFVAARAADPAGRFSFAAVPPGQYVVRARYEEGLAEARCEVTPGRAVWVELGGPEPR